MARNPINEAVGSVLGRSVAHHLADAVVSVRKRMAPIEQSHRIDVNNAWMEDAERRLQPLVQSILADIPDGPDTPEWIRQIKATAGAPKNQTDFFVYLIAIIGAALVGIPALGAVGIQPTLNRAWAAAPTRPLSPEILADMVERGIRDAVQAGAVAAQSGIDGIDFADMVLDTGEPPGIVEMVALWKRGGLDEATLNRMIAYSRIRTEWTKHVKDAFQSTMSGATAVEATVKGVITPDKGADLFEKSGGLREQFQAVLDTAGDAIGVQQANSLYLHGLITHAELQKVILHSRINPVFEPMAEKLRFHYLSVYQISNALKTGAATPAQATKWLTEEGYPADQIAAFVHDGSVAKVQHHKTLTEGQILSLYEAHEITADQVHTLLVAIGYTDDEVAPIIQTYDAKKILAAQAQAVAAIRKAFMARRTPDAAAAAELSALGVSSAARDHYIADWTVERKTQFQSLTEAQVAKAAKEGIITWAQAIDRWLLMGYSVEDAGILAQLSGYQPGQP